MEKHNCPNCGAPITGSECEYCGSVFYDFASLDTNGINYVRLRVWDEAVTFRVGVCGFNFEHSVDSHPMIHIDMVVYPDEKRKKKWSL